MREVLFEMQHGLKARKFQVSRRSLPKDSEDNTEFLVTRSLGFLRIRHGSIKGTVTETPGKVIFDERRTENLRHNKIGHVPGLIQAVITEIVDRGVTTEWHSSIALTEGGEILYQRLSEEPRLSVEQALINGGWVNVVTKRNSG